MYDIAIIGCGVIGAATAYALSRREGSVVVLEAANDVADGTTKANSLHRRLTRRGQAGDILLQALQRLGAGLGHGGIPTMADT